MFHKINANDAKNEDGFAVRVRYLPNGIEYEEGIVQYILDHDFGKDEYGNSFMIVYASLLRREDGVVISDLKKEQILKRISAALTFLGISYRFEANSNLTINDRKLESSEGYSLELLDEGIVRYAEHQRSITFKVYADGEGGVKIELSQFKEWDPKFYSTPRIITNNELVLISHRITNAMFEFGYQPVVFAK